MRSLLSFITGLCASAAVAALPLPELRENEIVRVDPAARTIVIGAGSAAPQTYRCAERAAILLDDKPATLRDLAPGMIAVITATAPGVASRVAAIKLRQAPPQARQPLFTKRFKISAKALPNRALAFGNMRGGQLVTITVNGGKWCSGGAKAGKFCDWHGYPDDLRNGVPRMALVAAVGRAVYLPAGDTFRFTVVSDGTFYLFANDEGLEGNEGSLDVTVTVGWK